MGFPRIWEATILPRDFKWFFCDQETAALWKEAGDILQVFEILPSRPQRF